METKHEMRQEAIKLLKETVPYKGFGCYKYTIDGAIAGVFVDIEGGFNVDDVRKRLIDLLTDDDDMDNYMRLPVDANDVPIHVGDRVVEHEDGHDFTVDGYEYDGEWWVFHRDGIRAPAHDCTHYKVEDVLNELARTVYENAWYDGKSGVRYDTYEDLVKVYAERLRLKEGE